MATESPTGLIPEELMDATRRQDVIDFLLRQAWPSRLKRDVFFGWARTVFTRLTGDEVSLVESSGVDLPPKR